jgi:1,4-dihydroxy-2-naphthoate polyprenyltransferase
MDVETHKSSESKSKAWVKAMRLSTLPLAIASTLTGAFLALHQGWFDPFLFAMTAITTVLLQINSNLANDYGDFQQGTDNDERVGPMRALQSGVLRPEEVRNGIIGFSVLSLISGVLLLYFSNLELIEKVILFALGLAAIYASIKYTAGSNPYGYRGLGDLSVVIFFGFVGVIGAYIIQVGTLDPTVFLPAISIGCFSAGVLNVNNTRDLDSDENAGKITLAVRLGAKGARIYHVVIILTGLMSMIAYGLLNFDKWMNWIFLVSLPLFLLNAVKVYTTHEAIKLDPWLKQLALTTFFFALLIAIGVSI